MAPPLLSLPFSPWWCPTSRALGFLLSQAALALLLLLLLPLPGETWGRQASDVSALPWDLTTLLPSAL